MRQTANSNRVQTRTTSSMCHATKSNNRTRFSTHYPFTYFDDERKSGVKTRAAAFRSLGWQIARTPFSPFFSLSLFGSIREACLREPPDRNTSLCAVENSPQVCCQTSTCSEKARIYIYSLAISPFCSSFIFHFYFSRPRLEETVARANY